jgi:endonuclease I
MPTKNGDIARIAFYMSKTYGVVYSKRQQLLFEKWVKLDPISEEERKHNNKIIEVQKFGLKL